MHQALALFLVAAWAPRIHFSDPQPSIPEDVPPVAVESKDPWRLGAALGLPEWLQVSGAVRLRHEAIDGQYRGNPDRSDRDDYFVLRSQLRLDADFDGVGATVEGIDSRQEGADQGSQINTGIVNTVDILQAHLRLRLGAFHTFTAGRFTMDRGSRRLVARNRFRNTINAFDGGAWEWRGEGGAGLSVFYTLPVRRLPTERSELLDNEQESDDQDPDNVFYGAYFETPLAKSTKLEVYLYGLDDSTSAQRDHHTPGFRVKNDPAQGSLDYELESALQFGDAADLDHLAWFGHASVGYTFDAGWSPRVRLAWDYASGDREPDDDESNRFDTLFGARRFEYGPTGIYGAVARSNLNSPEVRLTLKPNKRTSFMTAFRGIWLAESRDAWVPAGVRDPTGAAGSHVGEQLEVRLRYDIVPKSLRFELGGAYLFAGSFQDRAPDGRGEDTAYGYAQLSWLF